jgi:hypothetical protein
MTLIIWSCHTRNDNLGLKVCLFQPGYRLGKLNLVVSLILSPQVKRLRVQGATNLRIASLVRQVTRMDEDISLGKFDRAIMSIRDADDPGPPPPRRRCHDDG